MSATLACLCCVTQRSLSLLCTRRAVILLSAWCPYLLCTCCSRYFVVSMVPIYFLFLNNCYVIGIMLAISSLCLNSCCVIVQHDGHVSYICTWVAGMLLSTWWHIFSVLAVVFILLPTYRPYVFFNWILLCYCQHGGHIFSVLTVVLLLAWWSFLFCTYCVFIASMAAISSL